MNSRSFVFEPDDIDLPLLRLKFCDNLRLKVIPEISLKSLASKFSGSHSASSLGVSSSGLHKIYLKDRFKDRLAKLNPATLAKVKVDVAQISIKKVVIMDRNPPSPYSVEKVRSGLTCRATARSILSWRRRTRQSCFFATTMSWSIPMMTMSCIRSSLPPSSILL